jgi:hypothetical protein
MVLLERLVQDEADVQMNSWSDRYMGIEHPALN